jgi:hypothetical protein
MYVGYPGFMGTLENGDHAKLLFAFFRPHLTSMFVLNTQNQPQTANMRSITTSQPMPNVVMPQPSLPALSG